ncbi:MAG TPA: RNA methyltransferase [bacterium]
MGLSPKHIKRYRELHEAKGRREKGLFLVEGPLLIQEALKEGWPLEEVLMTSSATKSAEGKRLLKLVGLEGISHEICSPSEMARVADAVAPQGAVALAKLPPAVDLSNALTTELLLICESVSDPGNLGTLLRTADWFGVETIILGSGSADPFNPKVVRASAGSIFRIKTALTADPSALVQREVHRGRQIYAAAIKGKLTPQNLPQKGLRGLLIGHEKRGISAEMARSCTDTVHIPAHGRAESLNLAVAAGILLHCLTNRR